MPFAERAHNVGDTGIITPETPVASDIVSTPERPPVATVAGMDANVDNSSPVFNPSFKDDLLDAAFRLENTVGSIRNDITPRNSDMDPDFDPFAIMPDEHEEFADRYVYANSRNDVALISQQIDREINDRQMLEAGGAASFGALLLAGIVDPINLIPVGGSAARVYKTGDSILTGAYNTARIAAGSAALAEVVLQSTQETRTYGEGALNITAATFLGGIIGGSSSYVREFLHGQGARTIKEITDAVDADLSAGGVPLRNIGAAAADVPSLDELATKGIFKADRLDDIKAGKPYTPEESKALENYLVEREGWKRNKAVDAVAHVVAFQDPVARTVNSGISETRQVIDQLAEVTGTLEKNTSGVASSRSVERLAKNWEANLYNSLRNLDDSYVEYVKGRSKKFGDVTQIVAGKKLGAYKGKLSYAEFKEAVGMAMRRGDEADSLNIPHEAKPMVSKAAKQFREQVYEPLKDAAAELKLFDDIDGELDTLTAVSYLNRTYDIEKLADPQMRQQFIGRTANWLDSRRAEAESRTEKFDVEQTGLQDEIKQARVEIKAVSEQVSKEVAADVDARANTIVDEMLDRIDELSEVETAGITKTAAEKKALAKKRASFKRNFSGQVKKAVKAALAKTGDDINEDIITDLTKFLDDADNAGEVVDIISSLNTKVSGAEARVSLGTEMTNIIKQAEVRAAAKSEKVFKKALKTELDKVGTGKTLSPEDIEAMINTNIAKEVRETTRKAVSEATETLRAKLKESTKKLSERRKLNARDVGEAALTRQELEDIAEQIARRIEGTPDGRLPYDYQLPTSRGARGNAGLAGPFKRRLFLIPDEQIEDFLVSDVEMLSKVYTRKMGVDVELHRKFGSVDMTEQIDGIARGWERRVRLGQKRIAELQKIDKPTKAEASELKELKKALDGWRDKRDADIRDIAAVRDRLRGNYKLPEDSSAWTTRAGKVIEQLNFVRLLGGMTMSAIPDIARPVMVHGLKRVMGNSVKPLITNFAGIKRVTKELRWLGQAADMLTNSRMQEIAGVDDFIFRRHWTEKAVGNMSDTFGMVSLMAPWNSAAKSLAGATSMQRIMSAIDFETLGKISAKEREYLRFLGISAEDVKRIKAQLDEFGEADKGMRYSNVNEWTDPDAISAFQSALGKDIDRIIVTPGQDKPLAATGNWGQIGRLMFQFKSFAIASVQRTMISGLQQADMAALNGATMAVGMGMLVAAIKEAAAGRTVEDWDTDKWLTEGVDRSGLMAWFFDANNMTEKATRGTVGLNAILGNQPMSRYASRNVAGAFLGPTFGTLNTAMGVTGNTAAAILGDDQILQKDIHAARRLMPYQNLILIRRLFDAAEQGINAGFGVPEK